MSGVAPASLTLPMRLQTLPAGTFVTLEKLEQGGSLQARRLSTGAVQFYWRYANDGRTHREPVGPYDSVSPPKKLEPTSRGLSIAAAREQCRRLSLKHAAHRGIDGLKEAKAVERRQYVADQETAATRATHSLSSLLDDYVKHQATQGRISAREAKNLFDLHVVKAWPALAQTPATEITQDQVIDMLRRLTEQGNGRTSNKLPGLQGRCLRLHLITGGQRIEQLVRLRWADVRADSITIYDTKGRPGRGARTHTVPIVKAALRDLQSLAGAGDHVFSTTKGIKPISGTTLSGWAAQVVGGTIEGFQLKRVRSGVETLLAANRISREIRGHVQSHGLTGIQARHYDGHDYMLEKREALDVLARELTGDATRPKTAKPRRNAASASPLAMR